MENVPRVSLPFVSTNKTFDIGLLESISLHFRSFDIDNHINICPSSYRGRSVTAANIQDYISNIVSKYLQVGLPQWQICVIPVVKSVPLARSDEAAAEPSTSAEVASGNDDTEDEQHQSQPSSNEQTTV